eukprot:356541-Chlamydomonas_euryale.AAC.3
MMCKGGRCGGEGRQAVMGGWVTWGGWLSRLLRGGLLLWLVFRVGALQTLAAFMFMDLGVP